MPGRVIIFSGKGGTGKTTVSAATAALLARRGVKTLIISSDPAHSLTDVICQPIASDVPTELAPNLYGLEIDTFEEAHNSMSGFQRYMETSYEKNGAAAPVAAELAGQPGLDEILSLNRLREEAESGKWDLVIVDTAPTGNTLRLLAYPEMIVGGTEGKNFLKVYKSMSGFIRTFRQSTPDEKFFNEVNHLIEIMKQLNRFLVKPEVTVRLVMNAEKLSLMETKRAYTFLSLYGIGLDSIIVNKLLPPPGKDQPDLGPYFDYWANLQQKYLHETEQSFQPLPILLAYLERSEPLAPARLASLAEAVYGELDPASRLHQQRTIWVEEDPNSKAKNILVRYLCLRVPLVEDLSEVAVTRDGPELFISFGRIQRRVSLPRILNDAQYSSFTYQNGVLRLRFEDRPTGTVKEEPTIVLGRLNRF
ncbi:MAG: ArsA family ATPase [Chloroflexota bacterium]|nr:TRC40/GET3/ArsA family transport-energizing ATPase [Chloroflexota bacterium]